MSTIICKSVSEWKFRINDLSRSGSVVVVFSDVRSLSITVRRVR